MHAILLKKFLCWENGVLQKLPAGFLKCNVDCALFSANTVMGIDLCFRDVEGIFVRGRTTWSRGSVTVAEEEAVALLDSLQLAHSQGLQQVIFKTDSKAIVNAINSPSRFMTEQANIVNQCKSILSLHTD